MVSQKFGNADPDMSSRVGGKAKTKERGDKPMPSVTARTPYTGMIGGPSNELMNSGTDRKSGAHMSYAKGGKVGGAPAPYNPGGFRNAAMEHKR